MGLVSEFELRIFIDHDFTRYVLNVFKCFYFNYMVLLFSIKKKQQIEWTSAKVSSEYVSHFRSKKSKSKVAAEYNWVMKRTIKF